MWDEVLAKKYGEPIDVANAVFEEYEKDDYKSKILKVDMTGSKILFAKKLDVMNEEFDTYVGALVADLIYKQHTLRTQTKENLEKVDNSSSNPLSQMLVDDLQRTDHLVYVDTALNLTEKESKAIKDGEPMDTDMVVKRSSQIAEKAYSFLKTLCVPKESTFSDLAYLKNMRLKTQIVDAKLAMQLEKDPNKAIRPMRVSEAGPDLEPVVIAGVAFFLDHINQLAVPVQPEALP